MSFGNREGLPWKTPEVADLAWAIGSPSLVGPDFGEFCEGISPLIGDDAWCTRQLASMETDLRAMDANPSRLRELIASRKDQRLGAYFEDLLGFWLQASPAYELVAHRLAVRAEGKTLGEFDFIVRDRASGEYEHWEVAVKFYLGVATDSRWSRWIGPGRQDTLEKKLHHLATRQLRLAERSHARARLEALGIQSLRTRILLKGRLFYPVRVPGRYEARRPALPGINPEHLYGWWCTESQFQAQGGLDHNWQALTKFDWLTAYESRSGPVSRAFPLHFPLGVIGRDGQGRPSRGFIVPDDWNSRA